MFIVFEGPEGSGKTTHIWELADYIKKMQKTDKIKVMREPGTTEAGNKLRKILLDSKTNISPSTELLLYQAARAELVDKEIKPALDAGYCVLLDRYVYSTRAYQGYGNGTSMQSILCVEEIATRGILPDIVFLLDLDVEVGLKRSFSKAKGRVGKIDELRFEKKAQDFHDRVRTGYLMEAAKDIDRFIIINAEGAVKDVQEAIRIQFEWWLAKAIGGIKFTVERGKI